jgi:hypothetical protein
LQLSCKKSLTETLLSFNLKTIALIRIKQLTAAVSQAKSAGHHGLIC